MPDPKGKLLVGTAKGAFILERNGSGWSIEGPHFAGRSVYAMMLDSRAGRDRIWAAATSWHFGAELVFSDDNGKTWDMPEEMRIKFPDDTEKSLENIWQIAAGADRLLEAATSWHFDAELVFSDDNGKTWDMPEEMRIKFPEDTEKSLENIWQIAAGADDDTLYVGTAPAAVFESHDNGATFTL